MGKDRLIHRYKNLPRSLLLDLANKEAILKPILGIPSRGGVGSVILSLSPKQREILEGLTSGDAANVRWPPEGYLDWKSSRSSERY